MRLLHTSDWHLGRSLHGVDLLGHQRDFLDWLAALAEAEQVDAILVSGDVFDRAVPPVDAVRTLTGALARLAEITRLVITSGNHDSPARLGYLAPLLTDRIAVRTRIADIDTPVGLSDDDGPVLIYPLPYLDPDLRHELSGDDPPARSHEAMLVRAMDTVRGDLARNPDARSVVMAHAFVIGGSPSESERDIRIGGVDAVPAGVFDGVDYVALGHLHGPQCIGAPAHADDGPSMDAAARPPGHPVLCYSGSPLAYSFSERDHRKSVTLVDLDGTGVSEIRRVATPVPRGLAEVRGSLADVLAEKAHRDDWARVIVTDPLRPEDLYRRVRAHYPHALVALHEPEGAPARPEPSRVVPELDPLAVTDEFIEYVAGRGPTDGEHEVLRTAYEQAMRSSHEEV